MKRCTACGVLKPFDMFNRRASASDGHYNKCKVCRMAVQMIYVSGNPEKIAAAKAKCHQARRLEEQARTVAWMKTPKGIAYAARLKARQKKMYALKFRVWTATNQAIASGRLIREPCEVCGAIKVHAHHDDYSKPLDVRWLCSTHHYAHHKAIDPNYARNHQHPS